MACLLFRDERLEQRGYDGTRAGFPRIGPTDVLCDGRLDVPSLVVVLVGWASARWRTAIRMTLAADMVDTKHRWVFHRAFFDADSLIEDAIEEARKLTQASRGELQRVPREDRGA